MAGIRYSEAMGVDICERTADGKTMVEICEQDDMPSHRTVRRWRLDPKYEIGDRLFGEVLQDARIEQCHTYVDQALYGVQTLPLKGDRSDNALIQKKRLEVDTIKFYVSKVAAKIYGDKLQHTGDGGGDITIEIVKFGTKKD